MRSEAWAKPTPRAASSKLSARTVSKPSLSRRSTAGGNESRHGCGTLVVRHALLERPDDGCYGGGGERREKKKNGPSCPQRSLCPALVALIRSGPPLRSAQNRQSGGDFILLPAPSLSVPPRAPPRLSSLLPSPSPSLSAPAMRRSRYFLPALRETPKEAEIASHRLMLRAGMVRQSAAGIYVWLPLGLRVLDKVAAIVREEQNLIGSHEILMPTIQPADLWRPLGALRRLRARDAPHPRPPRPRPPLRPDQRRGHHRPFRRRGAELQGSAQAPLSHPVEVPR